MSKNKKKTPNSKKVRKTYKFLYWLLAGIVRKLYRVRVINLVKEPTDMHFIVASNHTSAADAVIIAASFKHQIRFMAKKELFKIPLFAQLIRVLGAFPVDRSVSDVGAVKKAVSLVKDKKCMGIFPQGHRYNKVDPRKTSVKTGAAMIALKAGVPVLPVFIKVKNNKHFFLCRKEVIVGKPISIEEMNYNPEAPGEYQRVADYLFERVCELGD